LEDFLDGTIHKVQFRRLTREDRKSKLPEVQTQFSQHRIVGTLERLYEDIIKPSFGANPRPHINHRNTNNGKPRVPGNSRAPKPPVGKQPQKPIKINMIEFDPSNPLDRLEELDDLSSVGQLGTYIDNYKSFVVNNVNTDPRTFDTNKPCLICKRSGHSFDDCPVLKSIIHLRKHYIKWKLFQANEGRKEEELLRQTEINQLEAEYVEVEHIEDSYDEDTIEFSDAATEPNSNISDFTMGEL